MLSHTLYHSEITLQSELIKILGLLIALNSAVYEDTNKRIYRQIITYFQLKELEITELSNHQISQKRIHRAMTYTGSTVQGFWKLLFGAAL